MNIIAMRKETKNHVSLTSSKIRAVTLYNYLDSNKLGLVHDVISSAVLFMTDKSV